MPRHTITFSFLSPWHMGSGFGEGAHLDAIPVKTPAALPYIPGRSVKGLFREAVQLAEECGHVDAGSTLKLFGSRNDSLSRYETEPGLLRFSSATLGNGMEAWAAESDGKRQTNAEAVKQLFKPLASTRIDSQGLADDKTLRKIEVAIPVELTAEVEYSGEKQEIEPLLALAASLIRQAGSHRHRGLGRVKVTIGEVAR